MKIKSFITHHILFFLSGFLGCLAGVTLVDYYHGTSIQSALSEWQHYLVPLIFGVGMSLIGYFFWRRRSHHHEAQNAVTKKENQYKTLFENMPDSVTILDNEKRIQNVNNASSELFEYTIDEMIGMSLDEFIYTDDKAVSDQYFQRLEQSGSYSMYEGRIITKTGKIKWIQVNSTELLEKGKKIGSQDIIRDITLRKSIEIEFQETVAKLNELNSTKDKLFSIIAHDLRSPFNSILGLSQLLSVNLKDLVNEKQAESLKAINTTAQGTLNLLENLLNWAKSQTGQINFHPVQLSLKGIVGNIIESIGPSVSAKNISIKHTIEDDIEVSADENMLRSVISNLVSNAIKFTGMDGKILLSAKADLDTVEISISDDGIGIDKDMQTKLFDIKSNTSRLGTSNEKGSGLGLVLCKEFIQMHGGTIWVESDGKNGTTFKFTLPLKSEESSKD